MANARVLKYARHEQNHTIKNRVLAITPALSNSLYWISLVVVVSSIFGVLKSGFRQFDLFGVIIIKPRWRIAQR